MRALVPALATLVVAGFLGCNAILGLDAGELKPDGAESATDGAVEGGADGTTDAPSDGTAETSTTDVSADADAVEVAIDAGSYAFTFPSTGEDTDMLSSFDTMCDKGTYVEGTRIAGLLSVTRLTGTFELVANNLLATCPALPSGPVKETLEFYVNDKLIGKLPIDSTSGVSIPVDFTFLAATGPNVKIKILAAVDVPSGCGCIEPAWNKSKYVLR